MDAIFVDSNIPMYLVGAAHPNRDRLVAWLRDHLGERLVTSVEVYQEIIHRYAAIGRRGFIAKGFATLDGLANEVFPIERSDVDGARALAERHATASGRDCLHAALMTRRGIARVLTFDTGLDALGVDRLPGASPAPTAS